MVGTLPPCYRPFVLQINELNQRGITPARGDGVVRLDLYNLQGQRVIRLVNDYLDAGTYRVTWNGSDASGAPLGSGVYLYRISAGNQDITQRLILLK